MLKAGETARVGMAYALLAGGALGNLVDRLWYGAVVDFVSLHWDGYYWYVFNLADVWISLAVALLLLDLIRPQKTPD
jgi:signal peptidase II